MLERLFFEKAPLECARELIGCELRWGDCAGIVVETEAYAARGDEASHTFFRKIARAFVENHPAGTAYVYLNYGVHWMLNVLVKRGDEIGFVLIRALEPTRGIPIMQTRRDVTELSALCSGPGKLAKALGVEQKHHGFDLTKDPRHGFHPRLDLGIEVLADVRVGISRAVDYPWRFLHATSKHVSVAHGKVKAHVPRSQQRVLRSASTASKDTKSQAG